jgi:Polyketide cyclase / dehydrase and lipid transport
VHEIIAEVTGSAPAPRAQVFDAILGADTRSLFTGHGPVAAIRALAEQSGPWNEAGRTRRVLMSDGSSHIEELLYVDRPQAFGFELREASGPLGWLTHGAHGHWRFEETAAGHTTIRWRYVFRARDAVPYAVGWVLLRLLWTSYMQAALNRAIELASAPVSEPR